MESQADPHRAARPASREERRRPTGGDASTDAGHHELQLLRAAVEGGLDGMVVVSSDGVMISYNQKFQDIWPIPAEVVASGSDGAALASVLDKLVDPTAFLGRVQELYGAASAGRPGRAAVTGRPGARPVRSGPPRRTGPLHRLGVVLPGRHRRTGGRGGRRPG